MHTPYDVRRTVRSTLLGLVILLLGGTAHAASFTPGNVIVYRVGDGVAALINTGNAVFLDEYTPGGALVQSIALPTTASGSQKQLVASGTAGSEGQLTRSTDGRFLLLTGYASDLPGAASLSGSAAATVPRTIGRVKFDGTIDTSTALTDFADVNNPRGATSTDGTNLWGAGAAGGVRFATLGSLTSTQVNTDSVNNRYTNIFGGQLYVSSQKLSIRIGSVGTGTPTTAGQTTTNLPGFETSTGAPEAFFFADLTGGIPGVDTLYVADSASGIQKFSLVSGNWVANGSAGTGTDTYTGLSATVSGSTVTLYATRKGSELVSLVDSSGYNGTLSGTPALVATAAANEAFRGVAVAPVAAVSATPTRTATPPPGATATRTATPTATATPTPTVTPTPTATTTPLPVPFTVGNVVVYRVGDGGGSLVGTGNPVFLDEYKPDGTHVQTIGLPATASGANHQLVASGTAGSEGQLTRSVDGHYLLLTGYASDLPAAAPLSSSMAATVPRTIGRVKADGSIDTSTALTDFSDGDNPRAATSTDGTNLWACGNSGGVRFATLGSSTSTQLTTDSVNNRYVNVFDNQLYVSSQKLAIRVGTVGTGAPTTAGQTTTNLPGFETTGSPDAFFFADLDAGVAGVDTLYVADDAAGLQKFSLVSGSWVASGTAGTGTDTYSGLTATVSGTSVTLYATRKGGSGPTGGGELVSLVDGSGYNGTLTGTPTLLATAANNEAFRGVALAPVGVQTTGFVPPDKNTGKCEDAVAKSLSKLAGCVRKCHIKQADSGAKGVTFDEEACESTGAKSCRGKYNTASTTLLGKGTCPSCLDATAQGDLADLLTTSLDAESGTLYCAGTTAFGGDDPGFVPPDKNTGKCEDSVAKSTSKLAGCVGKCQIKQADLAFKSTAFDKNGCEVGATKSCRAKFDTSSGTLDKTPICPTCLDPTARGAVADAARAFLEHAQANVYCAGTVPLP